MCKTATLLQFDRKRITIITGHYGSGKTEFALQYALSLAEQGEKTAVVDLDIANPYFRSRQRQAFLEDRGISVYSTVYDFDITAEMPAITASIRTPLENPAVHTVIDAGGDDSGARVLIQFQKYFTRKDSETLCVVNANRPETSSFEGALSHIKRIETELSSPISGLISNTHLLRETTAKDIEKGAQLCRKLSGYLGIPLRFTLCSEELIPEVKRLWASTDGSGEVLRSLFPFPSLQMRDSWLDAPVGHSGKSIFRE